MLGLHVPTNYIVDRKLGSGGLGAVYRLRHVRLPDTFAALKVLHAAAAQQAGVRERFEQEARAAAAIGSHRVVRPLDVGEFAGGVAYIVMEYVDGLSLAEELRKSGPLPAMVAVRIALRIADTMVQAHGKGIIHRDLKPPNVMLQSEGARDFIVRILDFGAARATGNLKLVQTVDNTLIGTPGYLSPEQATFHTVDGRADVFSLGVILFEMLTGVLPWPAPTLSDGITALLRDEAPTVTARRPAHLEPVHPAIESVVARAIEKDPTLRFSMVELHEALRELLGALDGGTSAVSLVVTIPSAPHDQPTISSQATSVAALLERFRSPVALTSLPPAPSPALPGRTPERSPSVIAPRRRLLWVPAAVMLPPMLAFGLWFGLRKPPAELKQRDLAAPVAVIPPTIAPPAGPRVPPLVALPAAVPPPAAAPATPRSAIRPELDATRPAASVRIRRRPEPKADNTGGYLEPDL